MSGLFELVLGLVALTTGIFAVRRAKEQQRVASGFEEGLARLEREFGARFSGRRRGSDSRSAYGTIGEAKVALTVEPVAGEITERLPSKLVVILEAPGIPQGISFAAEGSEGEDMLTGDPSFDGKVQVQGEPIAVLALLNKNVRQKVASFVGNGGSLRAGRLRCHDYPEPLEVQVPALVRTALDLSEALSSTEGVCPRLARNAAEDPLPEVRRLNLLQLQEKFTAARETLATSRAALSDTSPWVRLAAARFLRTEVETLEALARDRQVPDQAAAEAVALLAARVTPERAGALLLEILERRTGDTQRQAIEELGRLRHGPAFGPLVAILDRADGRTAAAAAKALGALRDARAEAHLLAGLGRNAVDVRLAAARALGELGTVASVAPLLELQESRGLDAGARQAIRDAVAAIQSRLVGAAAGQLTVAPATGETGRLSLASSEAGALSLAEDDDEKP